ncbi:hypothetical protein [Oecophyllibacter saccharovorans]|uniref:Uncharacterized protein n=1 Tax=Oecophyllibacter saccharovorans TaxID=2558360 RepID=A0A506UM30_9PROT|nr:hypothetical protein [Oecophyllibacter saccharovorans]TPW34407.1 hypothetical protein E3202_07940 [Oecophyllibacter saccharovorans]
MTSTQAHETPVHETNSHEGAVQQARRNMLNALLRTVLAHPDALHLAHALHAAQGLFPGLDLRPYMRQIASHPGGIAQGVQQLLGTESAEDHAAQALPELLGPALSQHFDPRAHLLLALGPDGQKQLLHQLKQSGQLQAFERAYNAMTHAGLLPPGQHTPQKAQALYTAARLLDAPLRHYTHLLARKENP